MHKTLLITRLFAIVIILVLPTLCMSQKRSLVGLSVLAEKRRFEKVHPSAGLTFERQLTIHYGLETGLLLRKLSVMRYVYANSSALVNTTVHQYSLCVPLLYKYYSNAINVAAGATLNFYLAESNTPNLVVFEDYEPYLDKEFALGILFKIGKSIPLTTKVLLEPEVRYTHDINQKYSYYGVGLSVKHVL